MIFFNFVGNRYCITPAKEKEINKEIGELREGDVCFNLSHSEYLLKTCPINHEDVVDKKLQHLGDTFFSVLE